MSNLSAQQSASELSNASSAAPILLPIGNKDVARHAWASRHLAVSVCSSGVVQVALIAGLALANGWAPGSIFRIYPTQPGWESPESASAQLRMEILQVDSVTTENSDDISRLHQSIPILIEQPIEPPHTRTAVILNTSLRAEIPLEVAAVPQTSQVSLNHPSDSQDALSTEINWTPHPVTRARSNKTAVTDRQQIELPSRVSSIGSKANDGTQAAPTPRAIFNPSPEYPADALANRQTGRVILRVRVNPRGEVMDVAVHRTSGIASLDSSAVLAVRRWKFEPIQVDVATKEMEFAVPVRFELVSP